MRAVLLILVFILSGAFGHDRSGAAVAGDPKQPHAQGWITADYPVPSGLHKTGDRLGGNLAEAPSQGGQKDQHSPGALAHRQRQCVPRWLPDYLSYSMTLCIGLPVRQLIFPFHYFW